jgi:hypothetical protein
MTVSYQEKYHYGVFPKDGSRISWQAPKVGFLSKETLAKRERGEHPWAVIGSGQLWGTYFTVV